jgi:hypothetical protein
LGHCPDASTEKERLELNFCFEDIEMVQNDAFEILDEED